MCMVNLSEDQQYEIIVRYERGGDIYYDRYYYVRITQTEAIEAVKRDWHRDNDHLFPGAVRSKFYMEV